MTAKVMYKLSQFGQRAALAAGLDAQIDQSQTIEVSAVDLDLFAVSGDGSLSVDACRGWQQQYGSWTAYSFDASPSPADLLLFLRQRKDERAKVETAEAEERARNKERKAAEERLDREKAILTLREALAGDTVLSDMRDVRLQVNGVLLSPTDPEVGSDVQRMIDRANAAKVRQKQAEEQRKTVKAMDHVTNHPATLLPDGQYWFICPELSGESAWAKRIDSIDQSAKNGYCFLGPWLKVGATEVAVPGDLIICGSKSWSGSRKRGEWSHSKILYMLTPAGLIKMASDDDCKSQAIKQLSRDPMERVEKRLKACAKEAKTAIAEYEALDRTEYADALALIDERVATWCERLNACEKALAAAYQPADEKITDIDSAAAAIVAAGYRALSKQHHPDVGGSDAAMALISQARAQLRDMLKLAGGVR